MASRLDRELPSCKAISRQALRDIITGHSLREWKKQRKERKRQAQAEEAARAIAAGVSASRLPLHPSFAPPHFAAPYHSYAASHTTLPQVLNHPPGVPPLMMGSSADGSNANNQTRGILKPEAQRFHSGNPQLPPWQGVPPQQPYPGGPMAHGFYPPQATYPAQNAYAPHPGYPPQTGYPSQSIYPPQHGFANQNGYMTPNPLPTPMNPQSTYGTVMAPGPTQPPGGWPHQNLPPGARAVSPPRYPTAEDLKYKCAICGRFRSAIYHFEHPLPAGQIPPSTVCRRCRHASTDSENDSIADSRESHRQSRSRRRSSSVRSARRIESVGPFLGRTPSRRGRTSCRDYIPGDTYYDDENRRTRSISRSTSVDSIVRPSSRAGSGRSVIRHVQVEEPVHEELVVVRRPRRVRRVTYVDDDDYDDGYDDHYSNSRGRGVSQPLIDTSEHRLQPHVMCADSDPILALLLLSSKIKPATSKKQCLVGLTRDAGILLGDAIHTNKTTMDRDTRMIGMPTHRPVIPADLATDMLAMGGLQSALLLPLATFRAAKKKLQCAALETILAMPPHLVTWNVLDLAVAVFILRHLHLRVESMIAQKLATTI
ncbi:uncharacterized protein AB675_2515 [Cyphellophora attinorum]|uniref:Uncharacterized protein n=1 Tax=Cyphellophora attinorum TaxID=1664694 RepID=A0A0N1HAN0_9EURO|nr:uncharacterized protein AB675_2515 [Phialophora attinorum]KPI45126.1 hypothetical protein AB675_2515 [Phialophora attinorum]